MLSEFGNITFSQFGKKSSLPLVTMNNVAVESMNVWTAVGMNVRISASILTGLTLIVKTAPLLLENIKVGITNSSFGSLDLRSGCEAIISNCHINAESKPRSTLISADNSFLMLQDCEFRRFVSKHSPTILHGINNTQVRIERTKIHQNRAAFGAVLLHNNCSINIAETLVTNSRVFEDGFPVFVFWQDVQADITHSGFYKNVGHFGGTFWVSDNSSITFKNVSFQQNEALQGAAVMIHNNSKLIVINTTFSRNQGKKFRYLPPMKNFNSHLYVQPILQKLLQKAESDFNARKDYAAGGVVAASGSEVLLTSTSFVKNTADGFGGALAVDSKLSIVNCTFISNMARTGVIGFLESSKDVCPFADGNYHSDIPESDKTSLHISDSTFERNRADLNGGAIAGSGCKILDIQNFS